MENTFLVSSGTRCLVVLPQTDQQLPEPLLSTSTGTASRALSTQVHQLADTLPARSTSGRVVPRIQEFLSLTPRLCNVLLLLVVVVVVEVVESLLGLLDG